MSPNVIMCLVDGVQFAHITIPGDGCCQVRLKGDCAELRAMFVVRESRREKIGTMLFQTAEQVAKAHGKSCLTFTVRKDSSAAILFYRAMGATLFVDDGEDYRMSVTFKEAKIL